MSVFAWVCVGVSQEEEEEEEEEEERRAFSFLCFLSLVSFLCFCFFSLPSCVPDRDPHHAAQGAGRHNPKSTVWRKPQPTFLRLCFFAFLSFFLLSLAFPSPYRSSKPIAAASFPSAFAPNENYWRRKVSPSVQSEGAGGVKPPMSDGVKNAEKIRVLVLGDSGVGKTSLIELVCSGEELRKPRSTVGCAIHMKIHESRATVSLSCLCACTSEVIGVVCAW